MYSVNSVTANASFQKRSPEWRFLKKPSSRLRVDGRKRRFSSTIMSYIMLSSFLPFSVFMWMAENDSNTQSVDW